MKPASAPDVRSATLADAERICALCGQLGYPATPVEISERLRAILDKKNHCLFVAEDGGTVVGWIHAVLAHSLLQDMSAEITGLVIDQGCRGKGIGRLLLGQIERWAREKQCRTIRVRSNIVRDRAHAFYERLGYDVVKTQKAFRKRLE